MGEEVSITDEIIGASFGGTCPGCPKSWSLRLLFKLSRPS